MYWGSAGTRRLCKLDRWLFSRFVDASGRVVIKQEFFGGTRQMSQEEKHAQKFEIIKESLESPNWRRPPAN